MHFSKQQQQRLESLLDEGLFPEVLNFSSLHGFLCGLIAGPEQSSEADIFSYIFFGEAEQDITNLSVDSTDLIRALHKDIQQTLFSSSTLLLPCSLELEEDIAVSESLEDWSLGFFEAHLLSEAKWYQKEEDLVAEMLIPFLICIEEVDDPAFNSIRENTALFQNLVYQLPQALQDLYLFYHSSEH